MMKLVGCVKYAWMAGSPTDGLCLGYNTAEEASQHAVTMNLRLEEWDSPTSTWNKDYWKSKPEPWIVIDCSTVA